MLMFPNFPRQLHMNFFQVAMPFLWWGIGWEWLEKRLQPELCCFDCVMFFLWWSNSVPFWYGLLQHAADSTERMLSYDLYMQQDLRSLLKNKKDWPEQSWTAERDPPMILVMTLVVPEHRAGNGALRAAVLRTEHRGFLYGMPVLLFGLGLLESGWKKIQWQQRV